MRPSSSSLAPRPWRALAVGAALAALTACGSDAASTLTAPQSASAAKGGAHGKTQLASLVYTGYGRSCALIGGVARCSGYGLEGELGDGFMNNRLTPVAVAGGLSFAALSLGDWQSCGLTTAGKAYCWGQNDDFNSLGVATTGNQLTPEPVLGNDVFVQIGTGSSHSCALTSAGVTKCWGILTNGPQTVAGPAFESITHGASHICGLTSAGEAYCWGAYFGSNVGQLGYGTTDYSQTPLPVAGGIQFATLEAGYLHTCALDDRGRAYCWGSNSSGQLGDGTTTDRLGPTPVATSLRFVEIKGGNTHTCALTRQGEAYCWGNGYSGQLGDGTFRAVSTPVAVAGGLTFKTIGGAGIGTCGVTRSDAVYCWGWNYFGGIGDGTTIDRAVPTTGL